MRNTLINGAFYNSGVSGIPQGIGVFSRNGAGAQCLLILDKNNIRRRNNKSE